MAVECVSVYRCDRCMDSMDTKFRPTHQVLCAWLESVHQRDVETWLLTWMPDVPWRDRTEGA